MYNEDAGASIGGQKYYITSADISENVEYDYDEKTSTSSVGSQPQGSVSMSFYVTNSQEITNIEAGFGGANFTDLSIGGFDVGNAIVNSFSVNGSEAGVVTATVQYDYYADKGQLTEKSSPPPITGATISPAYGETSSVTASAFASSGFSSFDYSHTQQIEVQETSTGVNFTFAESTKNLTFTVPTSGLTFSNANITEGYDTSKGSASVFQPTTASVNLNDLCENAKGSLSVAGKLISSNLSSIENEVDVSELSITEKNFGSGGLVCEQFFENMPVKIGNKSYYASSVDVSENADYEYDTPLGSTSAVRTLASPPIGNVNIDFYVTDAQTVSDIDDLFGGVNYTDIFAGPYKVSKAVASSLSVNGSSGNVVSASASFNFYSPEGKMENNGSPAAMSTGTIYPAYANSNFSYSASQQIQNKNTISGTILTFERMSKNFTQKRSVKGGNGSPLLGTTITEAYANANQQPTGSSSSTTPPPVNCQIISGNSSSPPPPSGTGLAPAHANPFQTLTASIPLEDLCGNPKGTLYLEGGVVDNSFGASESDDIEESVTIENVTLATGCP